MLCLLWRFIPGPFFLRGSQGMSSLAQMSFGPPEPPYEEIGCFGVVCWWKGSPEVGEPKKRRRNISVGDFGNEKIFLKDRALIVF